MSLPNRIAARTLPRAQPSLPCDLPARRTSLHSYSPPPSESSPYAASHPVAAISGPQTRILIADDASSAGSLVHLLHGLGYCLTKTTSCGASALELAQDFRPSIVLIALDLPDMSGRYLARRLRGRAGAGQLRLIALAADYSLAGRDLARESGFLHHLSKPVGPAALQRVLRAKLV